MLSNFIPVGENAVRGKGALKIPHVKGSITFSTQSIHNTYTIVSSNMGHLKPIKNIQHLLLIFQLIFGISTCWWAIY